MDSHIEHTDSFQKFPLSHTKYVKLQNFHQEREKCNFEFIQHHKGHECEDDSDDDEENGEIFN